jgi:hypothetical protein
MEVLQWNLNFRGTRPRRCRIVGFHHPPARQPLQTFGGTVAGNDRISKEANQICFESGSHIAACCSLGFAIFLLHLL